MLPNGSCNSTGSGRVNTSAFLALGRLCPEGYVPDKRCFFPVLASRPNIDFIVGRPQDAPALAARGCIDGFVAFEDVVVEAEEAGLRGIEKLLELPFGFVEVVVAVRRDAVFSNIADLFAYADFHSVTCVSDRAFLARRLLRNLRAYRRYFGSTPPVIEDNGAITAAGNPSVRIIRSAGSCEPHVTIASFDFAVVVRSSGGTIRECDLKVIATIGTYRPAFFCRPGVMEDPVLAVQMNEFIKGLEAAKDRFNRFCDCMRHNYHKGCFRQNSSE